MKVLHLTSSFPRWKGDFIGSFVYSLCVALRKNGIEIEVLTPRTSRSLNNFNEFPVLQFPYMPSKKLETLAGHHLLLVERKKYFQLPFYSFSSIYNLLRKLKNGDLVHTHGSIPMGFLGTLIKQKRTIITCHGSDCRIKNPLLRKLSAQALQKSDKNTTTVGRLVKGKRIEDLLSAIPDLSNQYDCVFFIIGDGTERKRLEKLGRKYKNLIFLGEFRQPELILSFTDVFVLCSIEEGLSTALQEAMAMECMPVATNAVGCPEIIENGVNGYLFQPKNIQDLIEKTKDAIENNFGKYARKTILEKFNRTKSVKRFIEIYKEVIG
jgi:glycosyltransferase involved in cell wall biosynthesis